MGFCFYVFFLWSGSMGVICFHCLFFRGPPRFDGDRPRFGDREGYRGGPRGGDFGGEKGGAPADFQPSFRVSPLLTSTFNFMLVVPWSAFQV